MRQAVFLIVGLDLKEVKVPGGGKAQVANVLLEGSAFTQIDLTAWRNHAQRLELTENAVDELLITGIGMGNSSGYGTRRRDRDS